MKKALIIAVVILLCVSTLFGCGNSASQINVGAQMSNYTEAASDEDSERTEAVSAITTETSPYYHSFLFDSYENLAQALTSKSNGIYSDLRAEQLDYGRVYADTLSSFDSGEIDLFVPGINGKTASLRDAKGYVKISLMPRELYALPWIWYHCVVDNYDLTVQISYPSVLKNPEIDSAASYSDVLSIIAPDAPSPENFQQYESYNAIYEAEKVLADGRAVTAMISELKNSSKVYVMFYIDGVLVLLYADNQLFTESFLSTFDIVKY